MSHEWTPQRVNALIALWNEGLPTSEIGRRLEVTKNAVIGKVHRLGLPQRGSPIKERPNKPKKPEKELLTLARIKPGQCLWPIGDPEADDFHFCGDGIVEGKPYCQHHCSKAFIKITRDKDGKKIEAA